jgi:hypothetical protein
MRVDRIKKKAVIEAEEEVLECKKKLAELESTTAYSLWKLDLDNFIGSWEGTEKHMLAILSATNSVGDAPKKKKIVIKKK